MIATTTAAARYRRRAAFASPARSPASRLRRWGGIPLFRFGEFVAVGRLEDLEGRRGVAFGVEIVVRHLAQPQAALDHLVAARLEGADTLLVRRGVAAEGDMVDSL